MTSQKDIHKINDNSHEYIVEFNKETSKRKIKNIFKKNNSFFKDRKILSCLFHFYIIN